MTASVTVPLPLSPLAQNNPVNPLNSREKRNFFKSMTFGEVYDTVMGKNTQQGSQSEKEDMGSRGKGEQKEWSRVRWIQGIAEHTEQSLWKHPLSEKAL